MLGSMILLLLYSLGAQLYVFEPYWLNSNICVAHFHFWQFRALRLQISKPHSLFSLFNNFVKQSS